MVSFEPFDVTFIYCFTFFGRFNPSNYTHAVSTYTPEAIIPYEDTLRGNEFTMADLVSSLLASSSPRSSQDSFRSVASRADPLPSSSLETPSAASTFSMSATFQQAGLDVYDIDQYLSENANLRVTPSHGKAVSKGSRPAANGTTEPVALGTKTSYFMAALNTQCQFRGFLPVFEIEGATDFGGVLKLRDVNITSDQRWSSKKEAKERLAEKGLETVMGMEAKQKERGTTQDSRKNWVGMLHGKSMSQCTDSLVNHQGALLFEEANI